MGEWTHTIKPGKLLTNMVKNKPSAEMTYSVLNGCKNIKKGNKTMYITNVHGL